MGESSTSESSYSTKELSPLGEMPGKVERRFRNRGLEAWKQGRKVWCSEGRNQWDGKNTSDLRRFTDYIADSRRRDLVLSIIDAFESEIVATRAADKFRIGIIHGDFNDANILVDDQLNISGVIDFGDSVERYVSFVKS